jgi:vacuolar-type H+-ATPase subunit H
MMQKKLEELSFLVAEAKEEAEKFLNKGTKAAVGRARKSLQSVKKLSQEIRIGLMALKKGEVPKKAKKKK